MKIVLASDNKGKIKEIKELYKNYDVISLSEIENIIGKEIIVTENQNTFEKNALEKANCLYKIIKEYDENILCIADDSGLSIDALDGFPGVHTARWMDANDHVKNLEILKKMKNETNRSCHYTTVIAVVSRNINKVYSHTLDGELSNECIGENGFGFDEIFKLSNGLTLASISSEEKYKVSPRTKALESLKSNLLSNFLK